MRWLLSTISVAVLLACASASAGEIQLGVGASLRKSTWRGDWSGGTQLGLGYRFARVIALDFVGWAEPASVDQRLNTGVTFGATGTLPFDKVRPSLRLYFIHQHEEGFVSIKEHPFGALLGIGPGIRHRAGFGARLGLEIPFAKKKHVEWTALAAIDSTFFPDTSLGPGTYIGATGGIGLNYSLTELP